MNVFDFKKCDALDKKYDLSTLKKQLRQILLLYIAYLNVE